MAECVFHGPDCRGRLQWHHVIPQQRIRRAFRHGAYRIRVEGGQRWSEWRPMGRQGRVSEVLDAAVQYRTEHRSLRTLLDDKRNQAFLCVFHHGQVEAKKLYVEPPESAVEFAKDYGLEWSLEADRERAA